LSTRREPAGPSWTSIWTPSPTALYVTTDDLLAAHPDRVTLRPRVRVAQQISDAEALTLAVMQALLGYTSEARWQCYRTVAGENARDPFGEAGADSQQTLGGVATLPLGIRADRFCATASAWATSGSGAPWRRSVTTPGRSGCPARARAY
jgi:hypothetical protein